MGRFISKLLIWSKQVRRSRKAIYFTKVIPCLAR
jgi:hypothetical protein